MVEGVGREPWTIMANDLAEQVLERVERWRPEESPVEIAYLGEGDFCTAFLLNGHLVARVGKHAQADQALAREASLLTPLAPFLTLTIPIPTVLSEQTPDRHVITVHEQIAGTTLQRESWSAMPESTRSHVADEVGAFLSQLHAIDTELARSWGAETLDHLEEVRTFRERLRRVDVGAFPTDLARRTDRALARYEIGGAMWSFQPALVHADLSPKHILMRPGDQQLAGIIDWGDARIGDPARDFVYLYEDWPAAFLGAVLASYSLEGAGELLPRVHLHFVIVHVDWMIEASRDVVPRAGLQAAASTLERALADLEFDLARSRR